VSSEKKALIIGTRGSDLALWQTRHAAAMIKEKTEIRIVRTTGDRVVDLPLHEVGGMGLFTNEIEAWLKDRRIDLAVHSLKDLPVLQPPGMHLGAILERGPVSDLILVREDCCDESAPLMLKAAASVGASSLRRQSMLRLHAPQAKAAFIRGNVPTRLDKLRRGEYDAIIIARAGIERLGLDFSPFKAFELNPQIWLPAPGQGAIAVEVRSDDECTLASVASLDDAATRAAVNIERGLLDYFGVGCHAAFGAAAELYGELFKVRVGMELDGIWRSVEVEGNNISEVPRMVKEKFDHAEFAAIKEDKWLLRPYRP